MSLPKIGLIATGGTIASIGRGPLDIVDYGANNIMLHADQLLDRVPQTREVADVLPIAFDNIPSYEIGFQAWLAIAARIEALEAAGVEGVVITHGTASLEETAFFLHLTLKTSLPVVLVASMRPLSALSSDAPLNLVNALRVAGSPEAREHGVLVMLNDEIFSARDVTKTNNFRVQAFRAPDHGPLGYADGDRIHFTRRLCRPHTLTSMFDVQALSELPRVDISYSYVDIDGTAVRAFVAAGAKGIVSAGFAPGLVNAAETAALVEAVEAGLVVVQSSRAGGGRVLDGSRAAAMGFVSGEDFTVQKARILLALALTRTTDRNEIAQIFATY